MQSQAKAGESEDGDGGYVVKQHRDDQSSGSAVLRVIARKLAGDTERKQREGDQQLDHREATQFQYSR